MKRRAAPVLKTLSQPRDCTRRLLRLIQGFLRSREDWSSSKERRKERGGEITSSVPIIWVFKNWFNTFWKAAGQLLFKLGRYIYVLRGWLLFSDRVPHWGSRWCYWSSFPKGEVNKAFPLPKVPTTNQVMAPPKFILGTTGLTRLIHWAQAKDYFQECG